MKLLESTKIGEKIKTFYLRNKHIYEKYNGIHGYTTVIKNPGRDEQILSWNKDNLLTNGGRDFFHWQCYTANATGTTADINTSTVAGNFVCLSNDATAPAATDTVVAGEISTNGLGRVIATTRTHTVGTNTSTLSQTFTDTTATTSNVQKTGLFNKSSVGVLTHENTFTSTNLAVGDQLQITWTVTLG
jgi:hypothetical protein